jgi:hypothetical protein
MNRKKNLSKSKQGRLRKIFSRGVVRITSLITALVLSIGLTVLPSFANVPSIAVGTLLVDDYYDTLRAAFYLEDYYIAGACNGWVLSVINNSGLVPELTVDGTTVLELNDALAASECFDLVATREGGQSDYQDATNDMIRDVNAGNIRAGDIVIYTKNMNNYEGTGGPHWLHAAIVMKEKFTGTVENYKNYWLGRWKENYWGYPTIAHALAPDFGVEYYSPLTSPSSTEADDSGSTGYYVYRINLEKAAEAKEKATATEATTEETSSETEASTEQITEKATSSPVNPATTATTEGAESASVDNPDSGAAASKGGSGGSSVLGRILSLLVILLSGILLFLCVMIL